jgi:xanthine/CO dehydrogenase XdhC/CoxF family maturation factor
MQALPVRLDTGLELLLADPHWDAPGVLATVVATAGSTYRKAGARMVLYADGTHRGLLTGGCLEGDLALHAQRVFDAGRAESVGYDLRGPDDVLFGVGAGCEGAMQVLLEPLRTGSGAALGLARVREAGQRGEAALLVTVYGGEAAPFGTHEAGAALCAPVTEAVAKAKARAGSVLVEQHDAGATVRALVEWLEPPPHVLVCGAGDDAVPLVAAMRALGWRVTVVDHRPAYAKPERFAGATVQCAQAEALAKTIDLSRCHAALVMSHTLRADAAYLDALSVPGVPSYVGLLGPRARRERLLDAAPQMRGRLRHRLRGPVGLDLGAATPEAIALSIVAELHAHLARRSAATAAVLSE